MGRRAMRNKEAGNIGWWLGAIASSFLLGGLAAPVQAEEIFGT